jgi:hypothetical protein
MDRPQGIDPNVMDGAIFGALANQADGPDDADERDRKKENQVKDHGYLTVEAARASICG